MPISDNYWLADDGRVYASAKQVVTNNADPDYVAWAGLGNMPMPWPRSTAGAQTEAEMQAVVGPYGQFVNLAYYTAYARSRRLSGGISVNGQPFATDVVTTGSLNSAYIYTQGKSGTEFSWKLPDGSWVTLNQDDIIALQNTVAKFGQDCFGCEADTLDGITAGTVTTRAQIDAAFAAVSNTFTGPALTTRKAKKQ